MALSYIDYPGNSSTTTWAVPFQFLSRDDITVFDVSDETPIAFTWLSDSQISISPAVASGTTFRINRTTSTANRVVDFQDATVLGESDLDSSADQNFFIAQEVFDNITDKLGLAVDNTYDANSKRISNVADPVNAQDAVTKNWAETSMSSSLATAITKAAEASTSAGNAATSESNAATSETNAGTSATNAATSESNASTSESNAATSESNADADATATAADRVQTGLDVVATAADAVSTANDVLAAAAILDQFDDRYLGSKASDPTLDNDGNALLDGALYYDTTLNLLKVYDLGTTTWFTFPTTTMAGLTDVTLTSIASGEILVWNGSGWINQTLSEAGIEPADAEILKGDVAKSNITKAQSYTRPQLTDAATIAWNLQDAPTAYVELDGNRTLGLPTNIVAGACYALRVGQGATGSRTLAYNAAFRFNAIGGAPTLSTGANDRDLLIFYAFSSSIISCIGFYPDIAVT